MQNTTHIFSSRRKHKYGFTLVELMIVIAIIGLLAVALLPKLTGAQANARDVKRKADIQNIVAGLKGVYSERGEYPYLFMTAPMTIPVPSAASTITGTSAPVLMEKMDGGKVPVDPQPASKIHVAPLDGDFSAYISWVYWYGVAYPHPEIRPNFVFLLAHMENYHNANFRIGSGTEFVSSSSMHLLATPDDYGGIIGIGTTTPPYLRTFTQEDMDTVQALFHPLETASTGANTEDVFVVGLSGENE